MEQEKEGKRIKLARLHAMVHPLNKKLMEDEITTEAERGRKLTFSDIVNQELDGRYKKKGKIS